MSETPRTDAFFRPDAQGYPAAVFARALETELNQYKTAFEESRNRESAYLIHWIRTKRDVKRLDWLMARNRNIYTDRDAIDEDMADPDMNDNPHETIRDLDALGVRSKKNEISIDLGDN